MRCKMVYQHDESDCGAAAFAMIMSYYGSKIPIAKCRELTYTDKEGTNIYGIIEGAKKLGIKATGLSGTIDELIGSIQNEEIKLPLIAHIVKENGQGHFVVISKYKNNSFKVLDPEKGKERCSIAKFEEKWTGNIISFEKTEAYVSRNLSKGIWTKFLFLLKGQYVKLFNVFILSLLLSFLGIMSAFLFQTIVDEFGVTTNYYQDIQENCSDESCSEENHLHEDSNLFIELLSIIDKEAHNYQVFFVCAIALYLIQGVIQYIRTWILAKAAKQIDVELTMQYYRQFIGLPMEQISTRKTGEYLSRFSDAAIVRETISTVIVSVFLDIIMVIASGFILYEQNRIMFFVALGITSIYAVVIMFFKKPLERRNRSTMEESAETEAYIKEVVDGIETIKTNVQENIVISKGRQKYSKTVEKAYQQELLSAIQNIISDMVEMIGSIFIIWTGFELVITNNISIGSLISFFILMNYFTEPIKNLIQLQPTIQTAVIAADRLNDVLELSEEYIEVNKLFPEEWERIIYHNVSFQYGKKASVIENVNLEIKKGEKVAFVGESGSGKTTLAKLLIHLYSPSSGRILVDDIEFDSIELKSLRKYIKYVKQDAYLFSGTIKDNLVDEENYVEDNELDVICKEYAVTEMIENFPHKYDTVLTEGARNISAGQRQRLAIARALIQKPGVLILDEATSNLDFATEIEIKNALFSNEELTVAMITHRLASIINCDKIFVMEKGKIVEVGKHEVLIEKEGVYYNLWKSQQITT